MPLHGYDVWPLLAATCLFSSLVTGCNTVTTNAIEEGGQDTDAGGPAGDDIQGPIEALCDRGLECGLFEADFDQADCVQLGKGCEVAVEAVHEGAFEPAVLDCLEAPSCDAHAECMNDLLDACLEASDPGGDATGGGTEAGDDAADGTSGGDPALCELGVNALCTCLECTTAEAQQIYDICVSEGADDVTCFAAQVDGDQIDCAAADEACFGGGA